MNIDRDTFLVVALIQGREGWCSVTWGSGCVGDDRQGVADLRPRVASPPQARCSSQSYLSLALK